MLAHNMCQKSLSYVNKNQNGIFESIEFFTRQINEILTKQRKVELMLMKSSDEIIALTSAKNKIF